MRMPPSLLLLSLPLIGGSAAGQSEIYEFSGTNKGADFGASVTGVGDVDADGVPDVAVGAPKDKLVAVNAGAVRVFSGANGASLHVLSGAVGEQLGTSVSGVGDLDGDGFDDILMGAPFARDGSVAKGAAQVVSGATGAILLKLFGQKAGDLFGQSVARVGDVDLDGVPDFAVGAVFADGGGLTSGEVRVVSGATGDAIFASFGTPGDQLGAAVCGAGDLDGDGVLDFAGGAPFADPAGVSSGVVVAWSGADGAKLFEIPGESTADRFGSSLAGGEDMNEDGTPDLLVGAPFHASSGSATLFSGLDGSLLVQLVSASGDEYGGSVAFGGDVNKDGRVDMLVGARLSDSGALNGGAVSAISGSDGALLFSFTGGSVADHFGTAVAAAGDIDGDGFDDLVVGSPHKDGPSVVDTGAAFVFTSCDATNLAYGAGCPGSQGFAPEMRLMGCPMPMVPLMLTIEKVKGGAVGVIFFGLQAGSVMITPSCALLVQPILPPVVALVASSGGAGAGRVDVEAMVPAGHPPSTYTAQAFFLDFGAPGHVSATNGILVEIP